MKFDICLMNPPYSKGNLELRFLEKVIQISDTVVSIQPCRWLQDSLVNYKRTTNYKKYENSISKYIKDFEFIPAKNARNDFNIGLMMDVGIFVCDKNGGYDYSKLSNNNFITNIISNSPSLFEDHIEWFKDDGIRVKIRTILPSGDNRSIKLSKCGIGQNEEIIIDGKLKNGKPWQTLSGMNKKKKHIPVSIKFKTENEAQNFLNSFYTNFMIYYYSQCFNDQHVYFNVLPFMNDYIKPWTDERFYKYFNIDENKQKEIEEYIKARE